jgi:PPE-repeat protein
VTFPMWFALPPEVHSTLLSTGAGPGPLLGAAAAWRALATEYAYAATELTELLAAVQAAAWVGPSAERFVAAHQPFLFWLGEANAVATAAATGHESAAAGYTSALAAMPTLAELAANHAVHAVLVATNFFGVNTIPIALNEADYLRMWLQAATTMSVYQAVSVESLAATPTTSSAPQIVSAAATSAADSSFPDPTKLILQLLNDFLNDLQSVAAQVLPGPLGGVVVQVLDSLISLVSSEVFTILAYSVLDPLIYFGPFTPLLSPVLLPVGLAGLAGIAAMDAPGAPAALGSAAPQRQSWPVTPGSTPAATPAGTSGASAVPASAPPGLPAAEGFYVVGGGPDREGFTPVSGSKAAALSAGAAAAAANVPAGSDHARAKRTGKARHRARKFRFEYLDEDGRMTLSADPPPAEAITASEGGSGTLGFAGTVPNPVAAEAKGLTRLTRDELGEAPQEPMLPNTWDISD